MKEFGGPFGVAFLAVMLTVSIFAALALLKQCGAPRWRGDDED